MKDIYELLNDIEVDADVDEMSPVSDLEKKKVFKELNHRIGKAKKQSKWKRALSVAIVTFGIISSAMVGLSFTAYAEDIPFLGNIFKFFSSDGSYVGYDENAEKLDLVQDSNGIKISINDTVFDGKTLYITYMIETDKDLGDSPSVNSMPFYGDNGLSGSENISRIEEGKYVGVLEAEHYELNELDKINVNWDIESVSTEVNNKGTVYEGNWEFQFKVNAVETQNVALNKTIEKGGITLTVENITITPMSFILTYQHAAASNIVKNWDSNTVKIDVKDNLGNSYKLNSATGYGDPKFIQSWFATYNKLDPNTNKLILTPIIELSDYETIGYDKNGEPIKANYRKTESEADYREIQLEDITVELK